MTIKKLSLVAFILMLSSCAGNTGHQFLSEMSREEISRKIVNHKTNKETIRANFGDPSDISIDNDGGETWEYEYTRSESKGVNYVPIASAFYAGTNDYKKKLKIKFNSSNVAERHAFSSSTGETRHGMFQ